MEVTCGEPFGVENQFGARTTDGVEYQTFELVVRQAVLFARADVIVVLPERFRTDMTAAFALIPFEIAINEVFPSVMVLGFVFPCKCGIKATLIK